MCLCLHRLTIPQTTLLHKFTTPAIVWRILLHPFANIATASTNWSCTITFPFLWTSLLHQAACCTTTKSETVLLLHQIVSLKPQAWCPALKWLDQLLHYPIYDHITSFQFFTSNFAVWFAPLDQKRCYYPIFLHHTSSTHTISLIVVTMLE